MGLWGRDYKISGPTTINYSILPHAGKWDKSHIWTAGTTREEPLIVVSSNNKLQQNKSVGSFIKIDKPGFEISSMTFSHDTLLVRIFNAEGNALPRKIIISSKIKKIQLVELSGALKENLRVVAAGSQSTVISLAMPRFGIRTLSLTGIQIH
jgi:alpha-mannosidase